MKKISLFTLSVMFLILMSAVNLPTGASGTGPLWSDDFDSYWSGVSLHGLGGWKGWANDPTVSAFTTNAIAWDPPNSMDLFDRADMIRELKISNGLVHFLFHQYIPVHLAGTSYFIMLNQYDDAGVTNNWSVQVQHQSSTGLMIDDGTGNSRPYITNQWVVVCLEIDLEADTQVYYYDGELFYTGTWSEHISGGGITSIGAVNLFANDATSVFYDAMSLGEGGCPLNHIYLPAIQRP